MIRQPAGRKVLRKAGKSALHRINNGRMTREQYEQVLPPLRDALLSAQSQLQKHKPFGVVAIITGLPAAGRSEVVNQFLEWLDPKRIRVHALDKLRHMSRHRPAMWRYWNTLPARGEIAIYFMGWYEEYMYPALFHPKKAQRHRARTVERIRKLEAMLPLDRVRVLKLHLHVSEKTQRERIAELRKHRLTRWRVTREDRWLAKHYDTVKKITDQCLRDTGTANAPWHIVDGTDPQSRTFAAGRLLLDELEAGFKASARPPAHHRGPAASAAHADAKFSSHQAGGAVDEDQYKLELERLQGRFALLTRKRQFFKHGAVFAFEGMDAAGKGGAIRRLTAALDARCYNVVPVSAPTSEELAHPYLWRFWRQVPERGEIAIFDRSWYGRVLVERVRDLTPAADWQRAYDEIREFELQLAEHRLVHKFWLVVSKQEQLRRFKERDADPLKRFKVDSEDWANRRFYDAYEAAAHDMIERTHTDYAPWTIIEADDKKYARLKVLKTVCEAIERKLE